jgi:hypothetical protein
MKPEQLVELNKILLALQQLAGLQKASRGEVAGLLLLLLSP